MKNRREFIKNLGRLSMAGGLLGTAAHLSQREPAVDKSLHICINQGICSGCKAFEGCGLPQALSAKTAQNTMAMNKGNPSHE